MIPKIIHYCWFGKQPKPDKVQKCINTWYEKMPDYQIIEWNEENFDYQELQYTHDAYQAGKYAFVSDVARVKALFEMGGFYLDTDVEVFKSFDCLLEKKCIFGFEEKNYVATSFMACTPRFDLMRNFYEEYINTDFVLNGQQNVTTNVIRLTDLLLAKGLKMNNEHQILEDEVEVFPQEFFSPYDYINCIDLHNENSFCIHYFLVTWQPMSVRIKKYIKKFMGKIIGKKMMDAMRGYRSNE